MAIIGTNNNDNLAGKNQSDVIEGLLGDDIISGRNGNDYLYGEYASISYISNTNYLPRSITYTFDDDSISGQGDDDSLFGDVGNITLNILTVGNGVQLSYTFIFGHDTLDGDIGNDFLYGDVQNISQVLTIDDTVSTGTLYFSDFNYTFGNDSLVGAQGMDYLVGDVENIDNIKQVLLNQNSSDATFSSMTNNVDNYNFGQDILNGGHDNDILYGDSVHINLTLETTAQNLISSVFSNKGIASNTVNYDFNIDNLTGDRGSDLLVGDAGHINTDLLLNIISSNDGALSNNNINFNFANDFITGDDGQDVMYGDIIDANISLWLYEETPADAHYYHLSNNVIKLQYGDDELYGGNDDDVIYGDAATANNIIGSNVSGNYSINNNEIHHILGNDILNGGDGSDHLYGDIINITASIENPSSTYYPNSLNIVSGNDDLTGGTGDDFFHFAIDGDQGQGNDIIRDFNNVAGDNDTLVFHGIQDNNLDGNFVDDLDAIVNVIDNGVDVQINFSGTGSITLVNAGTSEIISMQALIDYGYDVDFI